MASKQKVKVQRHPLAFGITYWGPIPGTQSAHLFWDGPGSGLLTYAHSPEDPFSGPGLPVRHPAGRGPFQTLREAQRAVDEMVRIFLESMDEEEGQP